MPEFQTISDSEHPANGPFIRKNTNETHARLRSSASQPGAPGRVGAPPCGHVVQFYEDDAYLTEAVADFIGGALGCGEAGIIIVSPDHLHAIELRLAERGINLEVLRAWGQYVALDAQATLDRFMRDGMPDPDLFHQVLGDAVATLARKGKGVRAFGEMVAILWAAGNGEAAIALERLWNALGKVHSFFLFCAYPSKAFCDGDDESAFRLICDEHDHVVPNRGAQVEISVASPPFPKP